MSETPADDRPVGADVLTSAHVEQLARVVRAARRLPTEPVLLTDFARLLVASTTACDALLDLAARLKVEQPREGGRDAP